MGTIVLIAAVGVLALFQALLWRRLSRPADLGPVLARLDAVERGEERMERGLREELGRNRDELARESRAMREETARHLERIRGVVDEKLQETLERRLGESFRTVGDRLEQVHRGLGEMQALAAGVGDLKRMLTNVRVRGTWGEVQLRMLLEQMLTPEQYDENVATTGTGERVEFAIRLPGPDAGNAVWLPVDAKFPQEDYARLIEAAERGDSGAVETCSRDLENRIRQCARDIATKYVAPPATTDFAIMYLPTEGLYAEVLRRPGLMDSLQRELRVTIAGPTTLSAILNSLQMGFRTLAIQRRSGEVWELLGEVKTEFDKYAETLAKLRKKLQEADNAVEAGLTRTRVIRRKLKDVEALPAPADVAEIDFAETAETEA